MVSKNQWSTTYHTMLRMQISIYFRHLLSGVWKSWPNSRNTSDLHSNDADLSEILAQTHLWRIPCLTPKVIAHTRQTAEISTDLQRPFILSTYFCHFWKVLIIHLIFCHKALADIEILQNPTWRLITFADNHKHFLNQHRCIKCRWIAAKARHNWMLKFVFLKRRYL